MALESRRERWQSSYLETFFAFFRRPGAHFFGDAVEAAEDRSPGTFSGTAPTAFAQPPTTAYRLDFSHLHYRRFAF